MQPISRLPAPERVRGLLFDIDETLTTDGKLTADAYSVLERLRQSGRILVPITGRPAGWCDHIARMWPVDAVVGENGAFYFRYHDGKLLKRYQNDDQVRAGKRARLGAIAAHILAQVPGCALASDQPYRETDLAIDFCEDVPALPLSAAERIAGLMRDAGLTAKISSIHVNGWFGEYDKLATTRQLFTEQFSTDLASANSEFAYIGDSPNDAPMFAFFGNSVGVANVERFAGKFESEPKYVTRSHSGDGFAELAALLVAHPAAGTPGNR